MATQDIQVLACPKCGAASEDFTGLGQDLSQPVQCKACDTVYTLQQRQDDALQREQSLRVWVEQKIAGLASGGATGVDAGTRSYLFRNNFYPDLKRDVDRRLEDFENAPEIPVIPLKPLAGFPDYQPSYALATLSEGNNNDWLKILSTRLSAQRVLDFATTDEDQHLLKALSFRVNNLIYYANIARFLKNGEHSSLHVVRHNVQELCKAYETFAQEVTDESYRSYLLALTARLSGASLLLDVLIPVLEEGRSFVPEAAFAQLDRSARQYQAAEQQADACTYNPLYVVPLQQGIQKDLKALQVMSTVIKSYEVVLHSGQVEFGVFFDSAMRYVYSLTPIQSFAQLLDLLDSLRRMLAARAGEVPLPVINEWDWLQPAIDANKRKALFGSAETVGAVERHLHPYWIATLNYAEKQGKIFKSGQERSAFILADATSVTAPIVGYLLTNDPLLPSIEQGTRNFNLLDKEILALPALLARERAEQMMKQFANLHAAELGATIVKMLDLIYLPVAYVKYIGKNQQREQLLGRLSFVNQNLSQALSQTHQFLHRHGA